MKEYNNIIDNKKVTAISYLEISSVIPVDLI